MRLPNSEYIAWDAEWVDKGKIVDYFTMVSCAGEGFTYVAVGEENVRSLLEALQNTKAELITHNGWAADIPLAKKMGFEMPMGHDTIYLSYLDDETQALGLESLATKYLGVRGWKNESWDNFDQDAASSAEYAARDARYTLQLFEVLRGRLGRRMVTIECIIAPARKALDAQTARGIYINQCAVDRERRKAENIRDLSLARAQSFTGPKFNPNSTKQVGEFLLKRGIRLPVTETGKPSTSVGVLQEIDDDFCRALLEYRGAIKTLSTYVSPYEALSSRGDGRVHPEYTLIRTLTGRSSAKNLNVQQIPRNFKDFFGAPPGRLFVECDYCLVPETRVVTTDLEWKRIDSISIGDELIGFDESAGRQAKIRKSVVENIRKFVRPCYRVVTDKGEFTSSSEHMWVVTGKGGKGETKKNRWKATEDLKPGMLMPHWFSPWETEKDYDTGYLAGFMDGEGYISPLGRVGWAQNPGEVADKVNYLLSQKKVRSIAYAVNKVKDYKCVKFSIHAEDGIPLIGRIRSIRLIKDWKNKFDGKFTLVSRWRKPAVIRSVEFVGDREVIALRTSTKTYIAEGFQSHNCAIEFRIAAWFAQEKTILESYRDDRSWDPHRFVAALFYGKKAEDVTKNERQIAKSGNFSLLYLGNGFTLYEYANKQGVKMSMETAVEIYHFWHDIFPGFKKFYHETREELVRTGQVEGPTGQIRHFGDFSIIPRHKRLECLRQAVNFKVQNLSAHIAYAAMAELERAKMPCVGFVHDAVLFEFANVEELEQSITKIDSAMTEYPRNFLKKEFGIDLNIALAVESKVQNV
jgi:DNA polymerase I-like protein with 3'-5' exonuclease and polymerase domains